MNNLFELKIVSIFLSINYVLEIRKLILNNAVLYRDQQRYPHNMFKWNKTKNNNLEIFLYLGLYIGSYIRAHVLLNLLNKVWKIDKMRGLQNNGRHFIAFSQV